MATTLAYSLPDFQPFTKIVSADMNTKLTDVKNRFNWDGTVNTGLGDDNIQSNSVSGGGLTRATKLKLGTANHVIINDGAGAMSSTAQLSVAMGGLGFTPTLTANAGKAVIVNAGETGFELGSPTQSALTLQPASDIVGFTAGEAISANDAVCFALARDASNAVIYRVFKCDSDLPDRRVNFVGFAVSAAAVTPGTYTWTNSAALVASNIITWSINGRAYTQSFSVDNDTTLAAIATKIGADPEVQSASVVDAGANDRVINITGKGGLFINITGATVTAGGSQATVIIATTQTAVGAAVNIRCFGDLSGFVGLTVGARYYLSGTAGAITVSPTDPSPIFVGQALSSTILFVNKNSLNFQFSTQEVFVRTHGSSATSGTATTTVEHFNFTSWSAGTADSVATQYASQGACNLNGNLHAIGGEQAAASYSTGVRIYNKASWSAGTAIGTGVERSAVAQLSNNLYAGGGRSGASSETATIQKFDGAAWSNPTNFSQASYSLAAFTYSGTVHYCAGTDTSNNNYAIHRVYDGVSASTTTVTTVSGVHCLGGVVPSSKGIIGAIGGDSVASYEWSGSWSSSLTMAFSSANGGAGSAGFGPAAAFSAGVNKLYSNGGTSSAPAMLATTQEYNGSSWANSSSSSTSSRANASAAVF